jgi:hypothetical protein
MAITFEELKKNSETQNKQEPVTFESLQPQEIKEEPKIQPITFESIKKKKEENEIGVGENIYRTAIGALRDLAQGTVDFSDWIESPVDLITPDKYKGGVVKTEEDGYQFLYGDEFKEAKTRMQSQGLKVIDLPKVKQPTYFGGEFVRDVTGFVIPFSKLKMITPVSKVGKGTEIVARGALAEQMAFSPYEQRLSNLVEQYPSLANPVTKYLKADPNDTESEARFKMALEGVGLGTAIESIVWATKLIKPGLSRIFKTEKPEPKTKTGEPFTIKDQPDSAKEKTISERLQAIAEPLEDVNITSVEAAPGLLGRKWQTMASKVIDFTSAKFPSYKPLKDLPNQDKYLTLRGLTTGKLEAVKDLSKNVFETFENLKLDEKISVKNFLTKEGTESAIKNVDVLKKAKELRLAIDTVGKSLVDAGILSKEVIKQGEGSYLPRLYLKYFGKNSNMGYTKQRKELPQDTKDFLGEIQDVSLLGSKAIEAPMSDIVRHGFFKKIAEDSNWNLKAGLIKFQGKDVSPLWLKDESDRIAREIRDGLRPSKDNKIIKEMDKLIDDANLNISKADLSLYKKIPETKHYGTLRGSYIRKEIADDIIGAGDFASKEVGFAKSILGDGGLITKGTKLWKMSKVALNPPTQVRNAMSNVILLNLSGVRWRDMPNRLLNAWNDIGKNGVYSQIAKKYGVVNSTFSKQEMIEINKAYLKAKAKATGNAIDKAKYIAGSIGDAAGNAYQFIEILGKTAKIIDDMAKGIDEGTAALNAQKTLFDYSLVPPSVRYLRNAPVGMPFVTFYYKVLPNLLETAIRHPERYAPYIALPYAYHSLLADYKGVTNEDFEKLKKTLPEYLRDGGKALAMPVKDNQGRWQFLDFSYFLPWSAFTGIVKSAADLNVQKFFSNSGLLGSPLPQLITAILGNKDPFTQREIVNRFDPPEKKVANTMMYLWRMSMPTWLTDIGFAGKLKEVLDKDVNRYGDVKITMTQALTRLVGINIYPIDPQKSRVQNIKLMKNEITGIKSRRTISLKDRNLTTEERKKINNKYIKMIKERTQQIKEYIKESKVPERLK